jgi:hypothetical protein
VTFDDPVADRQLRCQRQLLRLRLLILSQDGMTPARQAREIRDATNAVIAEVEATSRTVLEAARQEPGAETFLWVRVTRLAMAADQAVNAARSGDISGLDAHLRHFDALTSAIWTVQGAVYGQEPATRRLSARSDLVNARLVTARSPGGRGLPLPALRGTNAPESPTTRQVRWMMTAFTGRAGP